MSAFGKLEWSLVPGPEDVSDVPDSLGQFDIAEYAPEDIAERILSIEGTRLVRSGPEWWDWRACYESDRDMFEVTMTLFETDPVTWGGSNIVACSDPSELLRFWRLLRVSHPRIWLHNSDCALFDPADFEKRYCQ